MEEINSSIKIKILVYSIGTRGDFQPYFALAKQLSRENVMMEEINSSIKIKILVYSIGTRGDFQPYFALAKQLSREKYDVAIATHDIFQRDVESAHFRFYGLAQKDPNDILLSNEFKQAFYKGGMQEQAKVLGKGIDCLPGNYRCLWKACENFNPDAIFCTITTIPETLAVSQKLVIPMYVLSTIPFATSYYLAPAAAMATSFQGTFTFMNSVINFLAITVQWSFLSKIVNEFRAEIGLPPQIANILDAFPLYNIYSEVIFQDPLDWDHNRIKTVGYLIDEVPSDYSPPTALATFLTAGEPPVYIGLGSMPILDCQKFADDVLKAVAAAGIRAILCAGWSELDTTECPPECLFIKGAPHEWLFPRCAAAVHHGGAGTTAASLRAGVPTIIFSVLGDQPFWAQRVFDLGCGPAPIVGGIKSFSSEALERVLREVVGNGPMAARAKEIGQQLKMENGVQRLLGFFEPHFEQHRNRDYGVCAWQKDEEATVCSACSVVLAPPGLFGWLSGLGSGSGRRYCAACGRVHCAICAPARPLVNYAAPVPVCPPCTSKRGHPVEDCSD